MTGTEYDQRIDLRAFAVNDIGSKPGYVKKSTNNNGEVTQNVKEEE